MKFKMLLQNVLVVALVITFKYVLTGSSPVEQDELSQFGSTPEREENAHLGSTHQVIDTEMIERSAIYDNPAQSTSTGERTEIKDPNDDAHDINTANSQAVSVYTDLAQKTLLQEKVAIRPHDDAQLTINREESSRSVYMNPASDTQRQEEIARKED